MSFLTVPLLDWFSEQAMFGVSAPNSPESHNPYDSAFTLETKNTHTKQKQTNQTHTEAHFKIPQDTAPALSKARIFKAPQRTPITEAAWPPCSCRRLASPPCAAWRQEARGSAASALKARLPSDWWGGYSLSLIFVNHESNHRSGDT